tara:strand:+ start:88 stop:246 length:159 start_codon:yes stop_codon:yes gene_type:complete
MPQRLDAPKYTGNQEFYDKAAQAMLLSRQDDQQVKTVTVQAIQAAFAARIAY